MTDQPTFPGPEPVEGPQDPEDLKIITLARSALARTVSVAGRGASPGAEADRAGQAACLRDTDGRTYAAVRVDLDHLKLTAVQVVLAMAVSSGARGIEAIAVAGGVGPGDDDRAAIAELAQDTVTVWVTDPAGAVTQRLSVG